MTEQALSGQSKTLVRGLSILNACAKSRRGLTLVEIAEATAMAPSTVHRLLTALEALEYLVCETDTGRWRIGVAGFRVGNAFIRSRDYVSQIRPLMVDLADTTGETVNLAILSKHQALFVSQVESTHLMRMVAALGSRVPLYASGAGKALLAALPADEQAPLIDRQAFTAVTRHTLTARSALIRELASVRKVGCAYDREEHVMGMQCVAAPVFNEFGEVVCALSVSGPRVRVDAPTLNSHGQAVIEAAARATDVLGGVPPEYWLHG